MNIFFLVLQVILLGFACIEFYFIQKKKLAELPNRKWILMITTGILLIGIFVPTIWSLIALAGVNCIFITQLYTAKKNSLTRIE